MLPALNTFDVPGDEGSPSLGRPLKPRTYQPQNDPTSVARSIGR